MKTFLLFAATALTLSACSGGSGKCDTGDSACESGGGGGGGAPVLENVGGDCTASTCTWYVQTSGGSSGTVELDMIQNGDPTYDCSQATEGQLVCGVWTEYHSDFVLTDFTDTTETKEINLTLESSYVDQVNNVSTIFDLNNPEIANTLTVMFTITDENGDYADCARYGYDSSYYAADCANSWD